MSYCLHAICIFSDVYLLKVWVVMSICCLISLFWTSAFTNQNPRSCQIQIPKFAFFIFIIFFFFWIGDLGFSFRVPWVAEEMSGLSKAWILKPWMFYAQRNEKKKMEKVNRLLFSNLAWLYWDFRILDSTMIKNKIKASYNNFGFFFNPPFAQ